MAGALAQILQRAKLAKQAAKQTTQVVTTSSVLSPPASPSVYTYPAGYKVEDSSMLNANRPVDEVPPAPTISAPAASVPALQSVNQTLSSANFDWKKYLPWILIIVALVIVLAASRKRSA